MEQNGTSKLLWDMELYTGTPEMLAARYRASIKKTEIIVIITFHENSLTKQWVVKINEYNVNSIKQLVTI